MIEGSGRGAEAFYTGKVFEQLKIGRPILSAIPANGAAAQLIRATNTGYVADFNDIEAIKAEIVTCYSQWKIGEIRYEPCEGRNQQNTKEEF